MKNTLGNNVITASLLAVAISSAVAPQSVLAQQTKPLAVNLQAQPLHNALVAIGIQYDVVVVAPYSLTEGKSAIAVRGDFSALDAIRAVLKGSGLEVKLAENDAFVIVKSSEKVGRENAKKAASLEHIVVLGEKVKRKMIDATSSVSVFDQEALNDMRYLSISNAVSEVANVVVLQGQSPNIRGVSGNGSAGGFNGVSGGARPRVTTLVDGVAEPFVADLTGDSGLWDMQQVEVFRGPQSTINGRNSMGGIIFVKTKDPSFDWTGAARIGYRNQEGYLDTAAVVSGPILEDELAFRLSAQHVDGESYEQEVIHANNPPSFDLNDLETTRVRGKLLWNPQHIQGLSGMLSISDLNEEGNAGRRYFELENTFDYVPIIERDIDTENTTLSLDIDYALNRDMSLDLMLSRTDYSFGFSSYDPNPATQQVMVINEDNWFVDARINFGLSDPRYTAFLGLSYFEREQDYDSSSAFSYFGGDQTDSKAIYGEVSYKLNPDWTLIAGGRIERESQDRNITRVLSGQDPQLSELDRAKTIALPKLVMQYHVSEDTTASLSVRKGYNGAGGALLWATGKYYYFDSESVITYEAGVRTNFEKGYLNANFFFNQYDDYQGLGADRMISNIDEVDSYGLELELNYELTPDLMLRAGLGLLESDISDSSEAFSHFSGNELSGAPGLTASLGIDYWFNSMFKFGLSSNYIDEFYGDFTNADATQAGDYLLTRINLAYESEHWRINAYVDNVFDEKAYTNRQQADRRYPNGLAAVEDPRNMGVSVTYMF